MNKWVSTFLSNRLVFRPFEFTDAQSIYDNWGKITDVSKYVTWWYHASIEDTFNYVSKVINRYNDNDYMEWLICLRDTGEPIGAICIQKINGNWEVGYNFAKSQWHKGYATEALFRVLDFAFMHMKLSCVYSSHLEENKGSGYVMKKCGMTYVETKPITAKNIETTLLVYKINRFDWLTTCAKSKVPKLFLDGYTLRPIMASDIDSMCKYFGDSDVVRYLYKDTRTSKVGIKNKVSELLIRCIEENFYYWVIVDDNDIPIGNIVLCIDSSIHAHVSYVLSKDKWGMGIMPVMLNTVINYAFTNYPDMWVVEGSCALPNKASSKVMEKCGMICHGSYKCGEHQMVNCVSGKYPLVRYQITRVDWRKINYET